MSASNLELDDTEWMWAGWAPGSPWNTPIARSWPAEKAWDPQLENEYSQFVSRLGQAVAQRRCRRLDACLRDADANLLFDPMIDSNISLNVDCGDLPYVLRGYFSFKRRLPFGFVCQVRGTGVDIRYMSGVTPARFCSWRQYKSPRALLRTMTGQVHSGMYRMAPEVETSDFYPVIMDRRAVRPGTVYYDPNGHVLTVGEVRPDGTVYLLDGHPDGSLTWKRFGQAFAQGGRSLGGGFKNFRPLRLVGEALVRAPNRELSFFDGQSQWDRSLWSVSGTPGDYHAWVRRSLTVPAEQPDPVADFRDAIRAVCRDVSDRLEAVETAVEAGIPSHPHPADLPWNIYGSEGDWEAYATPSRDARLKAAFRELNQAAAAVPDGSSLLSGLQQAWLEESARPECRFNYLNSALKPTALTLDDVLDRLFLMSFDPYHCPELRWGAPADSAEAATCPDEAVKRDFYEKEQRLRNRIDREYGAATPLSVGPAEPPDVDVRRRLGLRR